MLKTYLISALVGLGIAGAIFAFQVGNTTKTTNTSPEKAFEHSIASNNKPRVEPLILKTATNSNESSENLTDIITKEIGKKIAQNNPPGGMVLDGQNALQVPDPELIAEELLAKAAEKFNPEKFQIEINNKDLKISFDESNESLKNYFLAFKRTLEKNSEAFARNLTPALKEDLDALVVSLINMYKENQKDFYAIPVPNSLVPIHKKEISLLHAAEMALLKIQDYQNDPAQALLSIEYYQSLDNKFFELKTEINQLLINKGITL